VKNTIPVVFLHGFLESSTMWNILGIEHWPCSTLCIDLPGHGGSIHHIPKDEPSIEHMAEMVMQTLTHLNVESFHLVGHSMGGYIGLSIKKSFGYCKKMVLMNSTYLPDSAEKKQDRLRMAELVFSSKNLIVSQSIPRLFHNRASEDSIVNDLIIEANAITPEAMAYASIAMCNRPNHFKVLDAHKNDILMVTGKFDTIINTAILKEEANIYGLQLIELPNSGHMSHVEDTDKLKEILLEFIQ
jgi:pimeloyl-ACP methyl ester carboxylesterase